MTFLLHAIFILLLAFQTHSTPYTPLTPGEMSESQLIQDLQELGAEYTLQRVIFKRTSILPNGFWQITATESASMKISRNYTYYKFQVQLQCQTTPFLIRAKYVVSFIPSTGDTQILSYCYKIINQNPDIPVLKEAPNFVDMIWLTPENQVYALLAQGIDYTLADAMAKNLLTDPTYELKKVFRIQNISNSTVQGYSYLIQVEAKRGYNWRLEINVYDNSDSDSEPLNPTYLIYPNALRA